MAHKLEQRDFHRLKDHIKQRYGINLEKKITLVEGRLANLISHRGFPDFTTYIDYALAHPEEEALLVSRLSTNFTYFMREEQHYGFMVERALPEWIPRIKDRDLRIWSAGCSSGEEAYTIAMTLNEYFGAQKAQWDTTVLATDISERVLHMAKQAVYPADEMRNLPESYKKHYFHPAGEGVFQVTKSVRDDVVFGNFNLMQPTFSFRRRFHIIFCRNVMIYFDNPTKENLVNKFYDCLHPGGYLFVGMSETLSGIRSDFQYVKPAIYRRG